MARLHRHQKRGYVTSTDLASGSFGMPRGHTRTYTSELGFGEKSPNGQGMVISQLPFLIEGTATVVAVMNGRSAFYFDRTASGFKPRFFSPETLTAADGMFVLTDTEGNELKFHGFGNGLVVDPLGGKFHSYKDASGMVISTAYENGRLRSMTRTSGSVSEEISYRYRSPVSNLIQRATLKRNGAEVESAHYEYYRGTMSPLGQEGDLMRVMIRRDGEEVSQTAYQYYVGDGPKHRLKAVFGTRALAVLKSNGLDAIESPESETKAVADYWFSYDAQGRVKRQIIGGAGEYDYTYAFDDTFNFNSARWRTTEKFVTHDADTKVADRTYHANFASEVILEDASDAAGHHWVTRSAFDIDGRVTSEAMPSAAAGGANGLVTHYDYDQNDHYLNRVYVTKGNSTAPQTDQSTTGFATVARYEYKTVDLGANKPIAKLVEKSKVYPDGSTAAVTSYAYNDRVNSSARYKKRTTTLPEAPSGPGESATTAVVEEAFDAFGRLIGLRDGDGYIHTTAYKDEWSGIVKKSVTDADEASHGWELRSGPHANLESAVDDADLIGRPKKTTSPSGLITNYVYTQNLSGSTTTASFEFEGGTLPEQHVEENYAGTRVTYAKAGNVFTAWTTEFLDGAGRTIMENRRFKTTGEVWGAGVAIDDSGAYQSDFAYDGAGRLYKTTNGNGTTTLTKLDALGRPTAQFVGVGSNESKYTQVQEIEYDKGNVGDGNVTKVTQLSGRENEQSPGGPDIVSESAYDWRNRLVASRTGGGVITHLGLDNLGRATSRAVFEAAGGDLTAGQPGGAGYQKQETQYDPRVGHDLDNSWNARSITATLTFTGPGGGPTIPVVLHQDQDGYVAEELDDGLELWSVPQSTGQHFFLRQGNGSVQDLGVWLYETGQWELDSEGTSPDWELSNVATPLEVLERYVYDPHGLPLFLDAQWRGHGNAGTGVPYPVPIMRGSAQAPTSNPDDPANASDFGFVYLFGQMRWSKSERLYHTNGGSYDPILSPSTQPHIQRPVEGVNWGWEYIKALPGALWDRTKEVGSGIVNTFVHPIQTYDAIVDSTSQFMANGLIDRGDTGFWSSALAVWEGAGYVVGSATGVKDIGEAFWGVDLVSNEFLSTEERWTRGFSGLSALAFTGVGWAKGFRAAKQYAIRQRVMANIAASRAAREASRFGGSQILGRMRDGSIRLAESGLCFIAGTDVLESDGDHVDIENVRVGQRLATDGGVSNSDVPAEDANATQIDRESWRLVTIHAEQRWDDGTLDTWEVQSLQPLSWLDHYRLDNGDTLDLSLVLDLKEMGVPEGLSGEIISIGSVPKIAKGPGRVVLTTVNHLSNNVYKLSLENASGDLGTLGVTGWHKFFSESRGWVSVCELELGEVIRGRNGPVMVTQLLRDPGVQRVYNLTVEADHVYYVGVIETLAHNTGCFGVAEIGGRQVGRHRDIGKHHIIQNEAVEGMSGATKGAAPAIDLGPWITGMPHPITRSVQTLRGGGTYGAERRIGYRALRRAGLTSDEARFAIEQVADKYFIDELGWTVDTPTRIPKDRLRPKK